MKVFVYCLLSFASGLFFGTGLMFCRISKEIVLDNPDRATQSVVGRAIVVIAVAILIITICTVNKDRLKAKKTTN